MKKFSTFGWMNQEALASMITPAQMESLISWIEYQGYVPDDQAIRTKRLDQNTIIRASEDGKKFRLHRRLAA
jgi:hypothetical protein